MTAPKFQYLAFHPVTRARMGLLDFRGASWAETVNGGTTFTGKLTVPDNSIVASQIRSNTEPYASAIYATPGSGLISFGGPVVNRSWDGSTNTLTVTAIDWKSWFYRIIIGPKVTSWDPWVVSYSNVDQLTIASEIVGRTTIQTAYGVPPIEVGSYVSGVNRDYVVSGLDFKTMGEHLDELGGYANGGYEWEVEPYFANDGLPKQRVQFYMPQRGNTVTGLQFSKTMHGGNILLIDDMADDATAVASRIWAVGEGSNAESTPWASDNDPILSTSSKLRTDSVSKYSGAVLDVPELASYARTERLYRSNYISGITFTTRMDAPDVFGYSKGDRCRVLVEDRFLSVDARNARILTREMNPDSNTVKLTVNLNDITLPEIDTGGSI